MLSLKIKRLAQITPKLEKGIIPGWWDGKAHKITYFIVSLLFAYSLQVFGKQEDTVKKTLLSLDS